MRAALGPFLVALRTEDSFGGAEVLLLGLVVVLVGLGALWVWSLVELVRWPSGLWDLAGLDLGRWVLRVVLLGWIGTLLYWFTARRRLQATYDALLAETDGPR